MSKTKFRQGKSKTPTVREIQANALGAVQGDVPILRVAAISDGAKATARRIVALGETTGHHHALVGECQVYEVTRSLAGQLFPGLEVVVTEGQPVHIEHNSDGDHAAIEMTPGIYFIPAPGYQQVEYDGADERRVLD